jgi:photosystem II stability/assembly factor-like uncharacterized protein
VEEWLLPRLAQANMRTITADDFRAGTPRLTEIERIVRSSHCTIAIMTPAWVDSDWNAFEALLAQALDPAARRPKLIPVLLEPTELPARIDALVKIDLTREKQREKQVKRLVRDITDVIPVAPPWTIEGGMRNPVHWSRWVRRYRRELRRGAALLFAAWMVLSLVLQWPPFSPGQGWQAARISLKGACRLYQSGDLLLASSQTDFPGVDGIALWRSTDGGDEWQDVSVPALRFDHPGSGPVLAAITGFASGRPDAPDRIYATTTDVGLLRSTDAGEQWTRVATDSLPVELWSVATLPTDPHLVFVAGERAGLYRSGDGGDQFQRLDGEATCPGGAGEGSALPESLTVGTMLATADAVYVGTDSDSASTPAAGLYASRDGGDCWQKVEDAQGRYGYLALAAIPGVSDQLLMLTFDSAHLQGEPCHHLWQFQAGQGRIRKLWSTKRAARTLYVSSENPARWYTITDLGAVFCGPVDQAEDWERLPVVTRCIFPPTCDTDMAADADGAAPLVLAADRVYRLGTVPWYRRLWP